MSKNIQAYTVTGVVLILGFGLGLVAQKQFDLLGQKDFKRVNITKPMRNQLFDSQQASIHGQITAIQGKNLTVKKINNTSGTILASDRIIILKPSNSKTMASPSSSLSNIELNKDVLITLEMVNGSYEATLVQYVPPSPAIPPQVKPSLKPAKATSNSSR